jgi:hypothetical protein
VLNLHYPIADTDSNGYCYCYGDCNSYCHCYGNCNSYCHCNCYSHGYANTDGYCYRDHDTDTASYSVTKGYSPAKASADSRAADLG